MGTDLRVNREWSSRPDDQRFLTIDDLHAKVSARRLECSTADVALDCMQLGLTEDGEGLVLADQSGSVSGLLNNWSFGQLCQRAKAHAGYLRTLPAMISAQALQWSLETHERDADEANDARILVRRNGETWASAITSTTYGRIWDVDVVNAIRDNLDMSAWKVPGATYAAKDPKRATTLYASDRDVFIFLVNEGNVVEADGEALNRGFYVWNSETGSRSFGISTFTYDYVCDNRMIWGQSNLTELTIRHTSGGPHRFVEKAIPRLNAYAQSSALTMGATIRAAKAKEIGKDKKSVAEWMRARGFTTAIANKAYAKAEEDPRGYNPRTVWGIAQGLTDVAHDIAHTDNRVELETKAGALLDAIAAEIPQKELR